MDKKSKYVHLNKNLDKCRTITTISFTKNNAQYLLQQKIFHQISIIDMIIKIKSIISIEKILKLNFNSSVYFFSLPISWLINDLLLALGNDNTPASFVLSLWLLMETHFNVLRNIQLPFDAFVEFNFHIIMMIMSFTILNIRIYFINTSQKAEFTEISD